MWTSNTNQCRPTAECYLDITGQVSDVDGTLPGESAKIAHVSNGIRCPVRVCASQGQAAPHMKSIDKHVEIATIMLDLVRHIGEFSIVIELLPIHLNLHFHLVTAGHRNIRLLCAQFPAYSLAIIFQQGIGQTIPICKKGSKRDVANYRPISLTLHIGKLLERIIRDHIM